MSIAFLSLFKARDDGHRIVFEDPVDYIQVHDASGRSFQVSLRRHGGLIWLDTELYVLLSRQCLPMHLLLGSLCT